MGVSTGALPQRQSLKEIKEADLLVYETDQQKLRVIKCKDLKDSYGERQTQILVLPLLRFGGADCDQCQGDDSATLLFRAIPIEPGERRVDIIMPADDPSSKGLGQTCIASIQIPWGIFLMTSILRQHKNVYITNSC